MKPFRILLRNVADGFKSVFRNFSLSLASISCISITLILVAVAVILSYNVNSFTSDIEKDVTIVAFLKKEAKEEEIKALGTTLEQMTNVESVTFEGKDKLLENMMKDNIELEEILKQYDETTNPLQDTYLIKVKDIEKIGKTAKEIKTNEIVDVVKYGEGMVEELVSVFDVIKKITYVIVIGLVVVTAFLISNTIKITIQTRKRQIEIMRLVGASNSYIKLPFFFEGIILGTIGSILPIILCCYGYIYLYDRFKGILFTPIIKLVNPDKLIFPVIAFVLIIGLVVGAIGSYRAVRRYLKI